MARIRKNGLDNQGSTMQVLSYRGEILSYVSMVVLFFCASKSVQKTENVLYEGNALHAFYYKQRLFSTQPQSCLPFHELSRKCCLGVA